MNKDDRIKELAQTMNTKFLRLVAESQGDEDDARVVFWACDEINRLTAENEALQAEVERLRNTSKQCWYPIACEYVSELEQERDKLKDHLYKYGCEDIDVIRCLQTMAYEHSHSDVPRYKDLAKRTMDKYVERCTTVGSALAQHDAEVVEREANAFTGRFYDVPGGNVSPDEVYNWLLSRAAQLRQQAKEQ